MTKKQKFKIAVAQLHTKLAIEENVIAKNCSNILNFYKRSVEENCDLMLAPEMAIAGYYPGDFMRRRDLLNLVYKAQQDLIHNIDEQGSNTSIVFGNFSSVKLYRESIGELFFEDLVSLNSLKLSESSLINFANVYNPVSKENRWAIKRFLPSWGVFDEARWFAGAKNASEPVEVNGIKVGVCVCRDIWLEESTRDLVLKGAQIIVVPNASPYANGRHKERLQVISNYAKKYNIAIAYVSMISSNDEVIFEGAGFVVDNTGKVIYESQRFEESFGTCEIEIDQNNPPEIPEAKSKNISFDLSYSNESETFEEDETYDACVFGLKEFINGISKDEGHVVIGLSGGIDSALVATLACDAFGADRVHGVLMPSKYTSDESNDLAIELAEKLGISHEIISIEKMHEVATSSFELEDKASIVSENIQSRLRGMILMMLSNEKHWLVLATGNKSELAVGYCTLYGDTVGAYAPIKDVYKTQVYELCKYRNKSKKFKVSSPIPKDIIDRAPSAELKENQKDSDSLPSYEDLDGILFAYIQDEKSIAEIVALGFEEVLVRRIIKLVNNAEFKRKQAPLGTRLMRYNFGLGRRNPINTNFIA